VPEYEPDVRLSIVEAEIVTAHLQEQPEIPGDGALLILQLLVPPLRSEPVDSVSEVLPHVLNGIRQEGDKLVQGDALGGVFGHAQEKHAQLQIGLLQAQRLAAQMMELRPTYTAGPILVLKNTRPCHALLDPCRLEARLNHGDYTPYVLVAVCHVRQGHELLLELIRKIRARSATAPAVARYVGADLVGGQCARIVAG